MPPTLIVLPSMPCARGAVALAPPDSTIVELAATTATTSNVSQRALTRMERSPLTEPRLGQFEQ